MSALVQQALKMVRAAYAGQVGDDAYYLASDAPVGYGHGPYGHGSYGHGSFTQVAEACRVQLEPWENKTVDDAARVYEHIETILTATIGSETGDVADVKKGGIFIIDGFWWSVLSIAMRTLTTGAWARCRVKRGFARSVGSPGSVMHTPSINPGGRFDIRGK